MAFSKSGYQIFPQFFSKGEIEGAREAIEIICRNLRPTDASWSKIALISCLKEHRNPGVTADDIADVPFVITELPAFSETLRAFVLHKKLWAAAKEILGSEQIVYHFSNVTRKPARIGPNMSWHRDYPNEYICPKDSKHFFRALIPLEGMNHENGCTLAIPGTHRVSDETALKEDKEKGWDLANTVPLVSEPGDMIAIHSKTVHGGRENRSDRERNLIVIQFGVKTDSHLYWNQELFTGLGREEIAALPPTSGQ